MSHVQLLYEDLNTIKQLRGIIPLSELADRYKISYQRIYTVWKSDLSGKKYDEKLINVDRIIDVEANDEIDRFIESSGTTNNIIDEKSLIFKETIQQIRAQLSDLTNINKGLQRQLSDKATNENASISGA
ncbi:hypothetical protein ACJMK2_039155, partial [Sinanodonta woodiana]